MQIIGLILLALVVAFGFTEREMSQVSAFDIHALVMVFGGSIAATMLSSTASAAWRTLVSLRELVPFAGTLGRHTQQMEQQRVEFVELWSDGKRAQAVALAEASEFAVIRKTLELVLSRSSEKACDGVFLGLRHAQLGRWQPASTNWDLLAKLGPSFGLVGTVTGMVQLFANMGSDNMNIGAAMSLALVSTLYGIAFGAGIAGPIGHYLRGLLDERLGVLTRARQSVSELVEISGPGRGR
jgi:chemotaxis protein MotA